MLFSKQNRRVPLGEVVIEPSAKKQAEKCGHTVSILLFLHEIGNWGDGLTAEEKRSNDIALQTGGRIRSCHILCSGHRLVINTDEWRYSTFVYLAEDDE